jgi:hypothetical protein
MDLYFSRIGSLSCDFFGIQVYIGWPNDMQEIGPEYEFPATEEILAEFGSYFFGGNETYIWFYRKNPGDEFNVLVNTRGRLMNATHYRMYLVAGSAGDSDEWANCATGSRYHLYRVIHEKKVLSFMMGLLGQKMLLPGESPFPSPFLLFGHLAIKQKGIEQEVPWPYYRRMDSAASLTTWGTTGTIGWLFPSWVKWGRGCPRLMHPVWSS